MLTEPNSTPVKAEVLLTVQNTNKMSCRTFISKISVFVPHEKKQKRAFETDYFSFHNVCLNDFNVCRETGTQMCPYFCSFRLKRIECVLRK